MPLDQNRETVATAYRRSAYTGRGRSAANQPLRRRLAAPVTTETNHVRPEKIAKAKRLIRRANYPSKKVLASVASQISRYF